MGQEMLRTREDLVEETLLVPTSSPLALFLLRRSSNVLPSFSPTLFLERDVLTLVLERLLLDFELEGIEK